MSDKLDDGSIVRDCEVCHRTIWYNQICHHGQIPKYSRGYTSTPQEKRVAGDGDRKDDKQRKERER